jgi:hypothetical protein
MRPISQNECCLDIRQQRYIDAGRTQTFAYAYASQNESLVHVRDACEAFPLRSYEGDGHFMVALSGVDRCRGSAPLVRLQLRA